MGQKQRIKAEAERLDVMDKAAGVLAELLFDDNILQQIKDYRSLLLVVGSRHTPPSHIQTHVSTSTSQQVMWCGWAILTC